MLFLIVAFNYYTFINHQIDIRKIEDKSNSTETLNNFFKQTQNIEQEAIEVKKDDAKQEDVKEKAKEPKDIELYSQKSKPPFARILLTAKKDVWFQIRPLHQNRIYVSRTLPAGKSYWVTPWENVVLDVSNPASLEIILDGESLGFPGSNSKKIRGLFLDEKSLKDHFEKGEDKNNDPIENYYRKESEKQNDNLV